MRFDAVLSEFGRPVEGLAEVVADVRRPDGVLVTAPLDEELPGAFTGELTTASARVRQAPVTARGHPFGRTPFSREQLLGVAVVVGGDEPPAVVVGTDEPVDRRGEERVHLPNAVHRAAVRPARVSADARPAHHRISLTDEAVPPPCRPAAASGASAGPRVVLCPLAHPLPEPAQFGHVRALLPGGLGVEERP